VKPITRIKELVEDKILVQGAYQRLFGTDDGKIVLNHLIKHGFVLQSTFVEGDPHKTSLNEGSRRLVLSIMRKANMSPQDLIQALEQQL
jgi:hypothetical protein